MTTNEPSADSSTSTAVAEHEAGRLDRAEQIYRSRLAQFPDDLATLIGLGDVLTDAGQFSEAEELYRKAIVLDGDSSACAGAYDGLAAIRQDLGDLETAIPASKKAAFLRGNADDSFGVGNTLEFLGRLKDAAEMFVLATQQRPGFAHAHQKAAQQLLSLGMAAESIPHYIAAIEGYPNVAELHCNLANACRQVGKIDESLKSVRRAIELKPTLAEAHVVMGAVWRERRRPSDAMESFKRALELKPTLADPHINIGRLLEEAGQIDAASKLFEKAVELEPGSPVYHENLGMSLLLRGEFVRGWQEYDWRRLMPGNPSNRPFPWPTWDGSPLQGRGIVLFAEQGFGDTIQFLRYAKLVADFGGEVTVECQQQLVSLARSVPGVAHVIARGEPWPQCHVQLPLMSAPLVFRHDQLSIPATVPYIFADPVKVAEWKQKLDQAVGSAGLKKIGLAWAGSATHKNDKNRSIPVRKLSPLAEVKNARFISLQKGATTSAPEALNVADLTSELNDFGDTAALIANLDLVITADTAVAHLAGAMGKPVWIMMPFVPDWRWMLNRNDSPWYPTAKLFRQETPGDWTGVMKRVVAALAE